MDIQKTFKTKAGKHKRFIQELKKKYDIDPDELINYEYCGSGATDYVKLYFGECFDIDTDDLKLTTKCVCGQSISNLYYITDRRTKDTEPDIIVLGSECIKSFTAFGKKRFCTICHAEHKNKKYSLCNSCLTTCSCGGVKKKGSDKCNECLALVCECGRRKKSNYKTCWHCLPKRECEQCYKTIIIDKWNNYICWDCRFN